MNRIYCFSWTFLLCLGLWAQPPVLDLTFGDNGYFLHDKTFNTTDARPRFFENGDMLLRNYPREFTKVLSDGMLDVSFSDNGSLYVEDPEAFLFRRDSYSIDSQGRLLVAFSAVYNESPFIRLNVFRFTIDGVLDMSFGNNGHFQMDQQGLSTIYYVYDISILSDDSMYVTIYKDFEDLRIVKVSSTGNLVTSFGNGGMLETGLTLMGFIPNPRIISVLPDDSFYLLGYNGGGNIPVTLRKYEPDGSLDEDFGIDGESILPDTELWGGVHLDRLNSGKLNILNYQTAKVYRLNADGTQDVNFPPFMLSAANIFAEEIYSIDASEFDDDGRLWIPGRYKENAGSTEPYYPFMRRFNPDGSPDDSFGESGIYANDVPFTSFTNFGFQSSDSFVTIGHRNTTSPPYETFGSLARFNYSILSINYETVVKDFEISRTLVNDKFYIKTNSTFPFDILLTNSMGQLVLKEKKIKTNFTVDISDQPSGIFVIRISNDNHSETFKILKN